MMKIDDNYNFSGCQKNNSPQDESLQKPVKKKGPSLVKNNNYNNNNNHNNQNINLDLDLDFD